MQVDSNLCVFGLRAFIYTAPFLGTSPHFVRSCIHLVLKKKDEASF